MLVWVCVVVGSGVELLFGFALCYIVFVMCSILMTADKFIDLGIDVSEVSYLGSVFILAFGIIL